MNGSENSMPEKKRMNVRWVRLRRKYELVLWKLLPVTFADSDPTSLVCVLLVVDRVVDFVTPFVTTGAPLSFADATLRGRVSGR